MATASNHQIVEGVRCTMLVKLWACCVVGTSRTVAPAFASHRLKSKRRLHFAEEVATRRRDFGPAIRSSPLRLSLWAPRAKTNPLQITIIQKRDRNEYAITSGAIFLGDNIQECQLTVPT